MNIESRSISPKQGDDSFPALALQFRFQPRVMNADSVNRVAGGMLYRCRWCERGYCEDCLDWDKTELLGENLPEYELLGFPAVTQAYYIKCPGCYDHHIETPEAGEYCKDQAAEIHARYEAMVEEQALVAAATQIAKKPVPSTPVESLTDGTTLDNSSSGIRTPLLEEMPKTTSSRKRKAAPQSFKQTPTPSKRSKRLTV